MNDRTIEQSSNCCPDSTAGAATFFTTVMSAWGKIVASRRVRRKVGTGTTQYVVRREGRTGSDRASSADEKADGAVPPKFPGNFRNRRFLLAAAIPEPILETLVGPASGETTGGGENPTSNDKVIEVNVVVFTNATMFKKMSSFEGFSQSSFRQKPKTVVRCGWEDVMCAKWGCAAFE